jgi:TonB family C-terminal domain
MRNIILLLIFFSSFNLINAQKKESLKKIETGNWIELSYRVLNEKNEESLFSIVEQMPEFPGGYDAFARFLTDTLKYPQTAIIDSIEGRVFTRFSIDKNGKVVNVYTLEGVRNDLDSVCIRAISIMPNWTRPTLRGNFNDMLIQFTLPIIFTLDGDIKKHNKRKIE